MGATGSTSVLGHVLYLFSGPNRPEDGVAVFCEKQGYACCCMDTEISPEHDLLDDNVFERLMSELDLYDALMASPPCCTFSAARRIGDGGPQPLRSPDGPGRYGLPHLSPADKEKVKVGNVLAIRTCQIAKRFHVRKKPWIVEQPHQRKDRTSMFNLDEFRKLMEEDQVHQYNFDQCMFGALWEKSTDFLSNLEVECFSVKCNHPLKSWTIPWSGQSFYAAHPPLKGRQLAIPSEKWGEHMLSSYEPKGEFLTRSAAAYPSLMNQALVNALTAAISRSNELPMQLSARAWAEEESTEALDPKPLFSLPLRGTQTNKTLVEENNSLRNIHRSVTDRHLYIGKQICNLIERNLDAAPCMETRLLESLGKPMDEVSMPVEFIDDLRTQVARLLIRNSGHDRPMISLDPVQSERYQTVIRAPFMKLWSELARDPGCSIVDWLSQGAPAGLSCDTKELDGLCPKVESEDADIAADDLFTLYDSFENYAGVDTDSDAVKAVLDYRDKGYLREFDTLAQLEEFVGHKPVLSKLGCVKKSKFNPDTGTVTVKNRIILDCKQSQVSKAAVRTHKSVLPRVTDAVHSALAMLSDLRNGETLTMLIVDIVDAFWLVPLRHEERRFFCAKLQGKFYVFLRTAQGSRGAPLTFAAIIALAARLVQSLVAGPFMHRRAREEARAQVYVDDPLVVIRGTEDRQRRVAAIVIIGWLLLGFPLAFHKAVMAPTLVWVGVKLQLTSTAVKVEVPESKVTELLGIIDDMVSSNVVAKKLLRTFVGKAMAIASVLYMWRPFLHELYSALHCSESHAPPGCVWTKQIEHSLNWIRIFLSEEQGSIVRMYTVQNYLHQGPKVVITWDASPYGMGATLQVDGRFVEFFAIPVSVDDCQILDVEVGSHKSQQVLEALTGLIALRVWTRFWRCNRAVLHIRNDNVGALNLFAVLKGSSRALTLIASEFALDLGKAEFRPDIVSHIPGVTNKICDTLSRRFDPHKEFELPIALAKARPILPPPRNSEWWKSLCTSATPKADGQGGAKRRKV